MTSLKDAAEAIALERKAEVERLNVLVESERSQRLHAVVQAAGYQAQLGPLNEQLDALRSTLVSATEENRALHASKAEAEKAAAVANANCTASVKSAVELGETLRESRQRYELLQEKFDKLYGLRSSQFRAVHEDMERLQAEQREHQRQEQSANSANRPASAISMTEQ